MTVGFFFFSSFRWKTFEVKCNQYFQQFPRTLNRLLSGKKHWNPSEMSMMDEVQNNCYRKGWLRRCHNSKGTRLISPQEHMQIGDWTYGTDDIQCPLRRPTVISVVLYFTVDLVMFVCVCVCWREGKVFAKLDYLKIITCRNSHCGTTELAASWVLGCRFNSWPGTMG